MPGVLLVFLVKSIEVIPVAAVAMFRYLSYLPFLKKHLTLFTVGLLSLRSQEIKEKSLIFFLFTKRFYPFSYHVT